MPDKYKRTLPADCGHRPQEGDKCAVTDLTGKENCPETPKWNVRHKGKQLLLCDKCMENWLRGAYE
jgi:ribosomal protein L37AE/L43A